MKLGILGTLGRWVGGWGGGDIWSAPPRPSRPASRESQALTGRPRQMATRSRRGQRSPPRSGPCTGPPPPRHLLPSSVFSRKPLVAVPPPCPRADTGSAQGQPWSPSPSHGRKAGRQAGRADPHDKRGTLSSNVPPLLLPDALEEGALMYVSCGGGSCLASRPRFDIDPVRVEVPIFLSVYHATTHERSITPSRPPKSSP